MRWFVLLLGIVLVASGLYLRWQDSAPTGLNGLVADPRFTRSTLSGPVTGAKAPSGAQVWLGIPYAEAPVGALRWRAPQAPEAWSAPRDTTRFGAVCPQFASRLSVVEADPGTFIGKEDCLSLNVFAPRGADERAALPVMVFIHGGGNTIGSARPYDAAHFAQEQGVVIVTLNYRLGPLGWFSHRALRSTAADERDASGNFALLDLIAALGWVRDNIAAFGGNAGRVTLFGESAGARNIYSLLATPLAKGLFHGAIVQSGAAGSYTRARAENPVDDPQPGAANGSHELTLAWLQRRGLAADRTAANAVLEQLGDSDIADFLRGLPVEELMAPLATRAGLYRAPALFRDGVVLPERPLLEIFEDPQAWNQVPVLAGTNRDEMKLFQALSERYTENRFGLIPTVREPALYNVVARLHSRQWKAVGVDEPLSRMAQTAPELPLYVYRFDWDDMRSNWLLDLPQLLGAGHALELDFLFGPVIARVLPGVLHDGNRRAADALGRMMRDYWAGFAYNGKPGSGRSSTLSVWPRWTVDTPLLLALDEPSGGGVRSELQSVRVEDVKAELRTAQPLSDRQRCALYVDMFLDNNGLSELFSSREYQNLGCAPFPSWSLAGQSR